MTTIHTGRPQLDGGRAAGVGRTSEKSPEVRFRRPDETAGSQGTNPDQLFAIGYAACLASAIEVITGRQGSDPGDIAIDSSVSLVPVVDGSFRLGFVLEVTLPSVEDAAVDYVTDAHEIYPYSNAVRCNIEVAVSVDGRTRD